MLRRSRRSRRPDAGGPRSLSPAARTGDLFVRRALFRAQSGTGGCRTESDSRGRGSTSVGQTASMSDPYGGAWREAAEDLGIEVTVPVVLEDADGAETYVALVHDFGSRTGAVVAVDDQDQSVARRLGLWCSWLGRTYSMYDRKDWEEMLNDWGWFGPPDTAPEWYSGVQLA